MPFPVFPASSLARVGRSGRRRRAPRAGSLPVERPPVGASPRRGQTLRLRGAFLGWVSVPGVTMKDVAAAVGVSVASVSNAYNRPEKLSEDVRARILATGATLGYNGPSAAGRALRHGRADAVGIIYADQLSYAFRDPYAITLLGAVADVLEENVQEHQPAADPQRQPRGPGRRRLRRGRRVPRDLRRRQPPGGDRGPPSGHPRGAHGGLRRGR